VAHQVQQVHHQSRDEAAEQEDPSALPRVLILDQPASAEPDDA